MLEKRKNEIAEGLKMTEKMREEEDKFQLKKQKMLETTRKEAQVVIEEARKQAKEEEKEIIAVAHKEAEQIVMKGKADVELVRSKMEKDVRANAIELAVLMTKRLLGSLLSNEQKHKLIAKQIKELYEYNVD